MGLVKGGCVEKRLFRVLVGCSRCWDLCNGGAGLTGMGRRMEMVVKVKVI